MRLAKAGLTITLLILLRGAATAQEHTGLLFRSYETPIASRTSLHLSPGEALDFENKLAFSFELSFWRASELGYLLRLTSADLSNRLDLLYKPGEDGENVGLFKLLINGDEQGLELKIPAEKLIRNQWLHIDLKLDKAKGLLSLQIDQQHTEVKRAALKSLSSLNAVFGRSPYNLPSSVATPRFGLKNLTIVIDQNEHFWPMQKEQGQRISSTDGGREIEVQDPEWIVDGHQQWSLQYTQKTKPLPGIAFNQATAEVIIVGEDLITTYNLVNRVTNEVTPENSFPKDQGTQAAIYSAGHKALYGYNLGPEKAYAFDTKSRRWGPNPSGEVPPIYIWQHAPFENTLNGHPMIFAGYGFFTARNSLLQLDTASMEWQKVPLRGDIPEPRFMLGITEAYEPGQYFIYGGYGNESGDQELGFENLNDLYLLDLNDSTVHKLWADSPGSTPLLPSTHIVLSPGDSSLYAMGHDYLQGTETLELLKISINEPKVEIIDINEKLPFVIRNIGDFNLFLFYAAQTKELVSVLRINTDENTSEVKIHTISFPPAVMNQQTTRAGGIPWPQLIVSACVALLLVLIAVRKLSKKPKNTEASTPVIPRQTYAIRVLGEFRLTDPEDQVITQKLSPKLKELFLLILLNTLTENRGVTSQKLTEVLWPDASAASAKNNRGVNLQKLRQALSVLPDVEVKFEDNLWRIYLQSTDSCDLYHALQAIDRDELAAVMLIAQSGTLLPDNSYDWLDSIKVDVHFKLIQYLLSSTDLAKAKKDWSLAVAISRAVLTIDPVHDDALRNLIQSLNTLKKAGIAKAAYEQFAEKYQLLYGEAYPVSFDEILH